MKTRLLTTLATIAAIALSPLSAHAAMIGFEDVTTAANYYGDFPAISDQGFLFASSPQYPNLGVINLSGTTYGPRLGPAPGGSYALIQDGSSFITMSATSGAAFSLQDFFIKSFDNNPSHLAMTVTGYLAGQQVGSVISFTNSSALWQDITTNFANVTSVVFTGGFDMLDNVTVNAPTAVPEPASMALLGVGMLGTGVMARRRRAALTAG